VIFFDSCFETHRVLRSLRSTTRSFVYIVGSWAGHMSIFKHGCTSVSLAILFIMRPKSTSLAHLGEVPVERLAEVARAGVLVFIFE